MKQKRSSTTSHPRRRFIHTKRRQGAGRIFVNDGTKPKVGGVCWRKEYYFGE